MILHSLFFALQFHKEKTTIISAYNFPGIIARKSKRPISLNQHICRLKLSSTYFQRTEVIKTPEKILSNIHFFPSVHLSSYRTREVYYHLLRGLSTLFSCISWATEASKKLVDKVITLYVLGIIMFIHISLHIQDLACS